MSYYPVDAPMIFLPMDLNDDAMRIGKQAVMTALQRHQRFLVVAAPTSWETVDWLTKYARGVLTEKLLGDFGDVVVVEFRPSQEATNGVRTPPRYGLRRSCESVDPRSTERRAVLPSAAGRLPIHSDKGR